MPCMPGTLGGGIFPAWALPLSIAFTRQCVDMSLPGLLTGTNQGRRPKAVPGSRAGSRPEWLCLAPSPEVAARQQLPLHSCSASECFRGRISPNVREEHLQCGPFVMCL